MKLSYSIIIPVYNRPNEIKELLDSLLAQTYTKPFEIVIVEDGSTEKCDSIIKEYTSKLDITYLYKENSGPGQSRNEGMHSAKENYFIILDSDIILPANYLKEIDVALKNNFTDAFTAPDKAHVSFTNIQKAINYAMTSFLTTGGLRNNKGTINFQLRSFNMGLSKEVFEITKGFAKQNYGEDIDLSFRIEKLGLTKQFIPKAFVYHKRRADFKQFYKQTFNFGASRPILNKTHKNTAKLTYWFPLVFSIGFISSIIFWSVGFLSIVCVFLCYFVLLLIDSLLKNKNIAVAFLSILAAIVQFFGYGLGFLRSQFRLHILKKSIEETFPKMFS